MSKPSALCKLFTNAYLHVAKDILGHLDDTTFLSARLVCQDWRAIADEHKKKWREINSTHKNIIEAAENGDLDQVEFLIAKGADVDAEIRNGDSALHKASRRGHESVVALLCTSGAKVNRINIFGYTLTIKS